MVETPLLEGVIDLHVHASPSLMPRYADDRKLAREMSEAKMGGLALKAHEGDSAGRAFLLQREFPELVVAGGIVLNPPVGGINPAAVATTLRLGGKIVWLPTMYSTAHVERLGETSAVGGAPRVPGKAPVSLVDAEGQLLSSLQEVLELIRDHGAVMASGHVGGPELFLVVKAAREMGIRRILITHPEFAVPGLTVAEQREMTAMGVMLEKCYLTSFPGHGIGSLAELAGRIGQIGAKHCVLVTDFGQEAMGSPVAGMAAYLASLADAGIATSDLRLMSVINPRGLLGLD